MTELTKELKQEYQNYGQQELNEAFINASCNGELEIVKYLLTSPDLKEHANIHVEDDYGFQGACQNGHLEVVKYLLTSPDLTEHADIHSDDDYGFRLACRNGHLEVVKYLLTSPDLKEHADIHADNDYSFRLAYTYDCFNVVTYLLSFNGEQCIDFQRTDYNLDWAIKNKHDDVILAMMKNLKNNHPFEYIECLPKIEMYNKELYEKVKNIESENFEVNPQETSLFV